MATNLLAMPLVQLVVETGNNEDWVDSLKYVVDEEDPDVQLDIREINFFMEISAQRWRARGSNLGFDRR